MGFASRTIGMCGTLKRKKSIGQDTSAEETLYDSPVPRAFADIDLGKNARRLFMS